MDNTVSSISKAIMLYMMLMNADKNVDNIDNTIKK